MANDRPPILPALAREVRQKCKFGCIICGCPIFDIDHIVDWAEVKEHKLENLTLLCTLHHRQKTSGILSRETVRKRTENIQHNENYGLPDINFEKCTLILGNNIFTGNPSLYFQLKEKDFFNVGFDNDLNQVVINAAFFSNDGTLLFKIENNIYTTTDDAWDVEMVGKRIVIREGRYRRLLDIEIDGKENTIKVLGRIFIDDDKYIELNKNGIQFYGHTIMSECTVIDCKIGILIDSEKKVQNKQGGFSGIGTFIKCQSENNFVGYLISCEMLEEFYPLFKKGGNYSYSPPK